MTNYKNASSFLYANFTETMKVVEKAYGEKLIY